MKCKNSIEDLHREIEIINKEKNEIKEKNKQFQEENFEKDLKLREEIEKNANIRGKIKNK